MQPEGGIVNVAFLELKVVLEISHIPIHDDNFNLFPTLLKEYDLSSVPKPLAPLALITPEKQNKKSNKDSKD